MIVQQLHPELLAGLDRRVDPERLVLPDEVGDRGRHHQELVGGDPPQPVGSRQQHLTENADQGHRQLYANLGLLVVWECIDDAVDRSCGARRVQRGEDQVSRLRGPDGRFYRF